MVSGDTLFLLRAGAKKTEITFQRKIGEGSLMRQMKARESGFPMPYQRTFSDPPLESCFGGFEAMEFFASKKGWRSFRKYQEIKKAADRERNIGEGSLTR